MEIEAQLCVPAATVQFVHYHFAEPPDSKLHVDGKFRVELCLTSRHRSARACFRDHWSPHRFERIGDLFVVPPAIDMLTRSDEDGSLTSIICQLEFEPVLELFDRVPELTDQQLISSLDVRDAKTRSLLLRLAEETRRPGFASEVLVDLLARQLAIELVRYGAAIADRQAHGGLASWQLRLIDERLKEVREAPTLPVLARLCRISVRQLTRGFRASRGCSIGAYVADSQLEHAKRLLAEDESVSSIAHTLGFSSNSNFCFAFRRATGSTPGQFRRNLLGVSSKEPNACAMSRR
jgi:AraC family transcriptional regulator